MKRSFAERSWLIFWGFLFVVYVACAVERLVTGHFIFGLFCIAVSVSCAYLFKMIKDVT